MIIGYGICGGGEAGRYMKATLDEFRRLTDTTIILGNNITEAERKLIQSYGFLLVEDNREWGTLQWKIKQDFIENHVSKLVKEGDWLVCLDMDEVFCSHITKEWITNAPLDAYHVFVVDLWDEGYKPESCFWNVRLWKWNGVTTWKQKPVHCGLSPEWTYHYHRFAPFLLKHYGLKDKKDRERKILRYEKYDPNAQHLDKKYYDMLKSDKSKPFNEKELCGIIEAEVTSYKQTKPKQKTMPQKKKYAYVTNAAGITNDIPVEMLAETLKQPGMTFVGYAENMEKEIEKMFFEADKETALMDIVEPVIEPIVEVPLVAPVEAPIETTREEVIPVKTEKKRGRPKKK
jgi:hypothetical protein